MLRQHDERHEMRATLVLGLLALTAWALLLPLHADFRLPIWNVLLFIAPIAFGLRGAYLIIPTAVFPIGILDDDWATVVRQSILLISIGTGRGVMPWLPGYVAVALAWAGIVLPLADIMGPRLSSGTGWLEEQLLFAYLADVLLALVAGAFLLNPTIYSFITMRPRPLRLVELSTHVLSLTVMLTICAVLATLNRIGLFTSHQITAVNFWPVVGLITTFVALPTLLAVRLAFVFFRELENFKDTLPRLADGPLVPSNSLGTSMGRFQDQQGFTEPSEIRSARAEYEKLDTLTGVCAIDADGSVLFMNDSFRAMADIVLPGTEGRKLETLAQESEVVKHVAALLKATDPAREIVTEMKVTAPRAEPRFIEIALRPRVDDEQIEPDAEGRKTPRVVNLKDVTERRTIERHLLAEQRTNSLGASLAGAAATFSDIFTTILARASYAIFSGNRDTASAALESISETAANAGRLARQLLQVADTRPLSNTTIVDARNVVAENVAMLQDLVGETIEVVLETSLNALPIEIEPALFSQSILNVVMNAREAYPSGRGTILLSVSEEEIDERVAYMHPGTRPGRYARLRVEDKGTGMHADSLGRAVDPLFTTKRDQGHTGLGLSTVFAIMREHSGFMCLESKPGKGTSVSLYFPLVMPTHSSFQVSAKPTEEQTAPSGEATTDFSGENRAVLIIEHRDEFRGLLTAMLQSLGYRTASCRDEIEAMSVLDTQRVDFLLVDDSLTSSSCSHILSEVRNRASTAVAIVMTHASRNARAGESSLLKPFDIGQLARALKAVSPSASGNSGLASDIIRLENPIDG